MRPKKIRIDKLRAGHCIDREPTDTFETMPVVPCGQPHDVEIYAVRDLRGGRWPGQQAVDELADEACRAAFRTYVGVEYNESTLEISWSTPTADGWRYGDRSALCILNDPAGRLVGSMKGSRK